jgi:predicted kinase
MSKRNAILEGLKVQRDIDEEFELLREDNLYSDIDEEYTYLPEYCEFVDEATMVTFDGNMFPKFGYAVIMAGGSGSGKSFVKKNKVAIDAKTIDVDELKNLYIKAQKAKGSSKEWDLSNPNDVSSLHQIVKDKGFKDKEEAAFFNAAVEGRLPNVIYDITGDDPKKLSGLGKKLKDLGYKVSLVWVVTSRQVAMLQNLSRSRVVSQKIFHQTHNEVAKSVFPFLKSGAKDYDEAWVVINSKGSAKTLSAQERKELNDIGTIKLAKSGSGFEIPKEIEMMIFNILGPLETNPENPEVYKDFDDVRGNEVELDNVRAGTDTLLKKTSNINGLKK